MVVHGVREGGGEVSLVPCASAVSFVNVEVVGVGGGVLVEEGIEGSLVIGDIDVVTDKNRNL